MSWLRLLSAALAGAVVMFAWSAFSHTCLIRGIGFTPLPNEDAVVTEIRASVHEDGLYFFPGIDFNHEQTAEENVALEARFRAGHGILVYHASSDSPVSPRKLVAQFVCDLFAAALAAFVVSRVSAPYWRRVLSVGALGAFGCLGVSALYWNWYGFTDAFFAAHCLDKIVGWLLAGTAIARLAKISSGSNAGA